MRCPQGKLSSAWSRQVDAWDNASHFVDYQDCQYAASAKMLCGGVTNLPQTPVAGGSGATYELGGIGLIDLRPRATVVPGGATAPDLDLAGDFAEVREQSQARRALEIAVAGNHNVRP